MKMSTVKLESFIRVIFLDQVVLLEIENVTWHSKVSLLGYYLFNKFRQSSHPPPPPPQKIFFHVLKQSFLEKEKTLLSESRHKK